MPRLHDPLQPAYWPAACRHLSRRDPVLRGLIRQYPGEILRSRGSHYETLLRAIVGQQISVRAAQSVWDRFAERAGAVRPERVVELSARSLRSVGLSRQKVTYIQDLSEKFLAGEMHTHRWPRMTDEELIAELTRVRGIGRWTAEMFLMFHLLRPDVFPVGDVGLLRAIALRYRKRYPPGDRALRILGELWAPYRSVATWYLWRSLDPIPVEY
jgi:DNA-3-methyladenine glycosylase II